MILKKTIISLLFTITSQFFLLTPITPQSSFKPHSSIDKNDFKDLLPTTSSLLLDKSENSDDIIEKSFHHRYLERQWQELYEEDNHLLLLEQSLLNQFGRTGFSDEIGRHPYHETPARRFQIIFLLSFPFTLIYSLALASLYNSSSTNTENDNNLAIGFGLGISFSALIGWHDYNQKIDFDKNKPKEKNLNNNIPLKYSVTPTPIP